MTKRIKYKQGDLIGKYGFIFLRDEKQPYVNTKGNKYRQAWFICPHCKKECLCLIQDVKAGKKSCGCKTSEFRAQGGRKTGKDITNKKFGKLIPKYYKIVKDNNKKSKRLWYCDCDCGGHIWTTVDSLTSGHTTSCGCYVSENSRKLRTKDITNLRSGKLVAKYNTGKQDSQGNYIWHCECDCGGTKEVIASKIINKVVVSCGCIQSSGENKIQSILENSKITFEKEKRFEDCINPKTKTKLRFDFYLPDYNLCIEYDGKQHFFENNTWAEKESLQEIRYRDSIKTEYCKNHNINLIRIPYTDFDKIDKKYLREKIEI